MRNPKSDKNETRFTVSMLPLCSLEEFSKSQKDPKYLLNCHRRIIPKISFLKRQYTPVELMTWNSLPLKESLCLKAKEFKDSVIFIDKTIEKIVESATNNTQYEEIISLLQVGLSERTGALVDEIYLQLMRRINGNEQSESLWKLMICVTDSFPPSIGMSSFILSWFNKFKFSHPHMLQIRAIKRCHCNFNVFRISGPIAYNTSIEDVEFWMKESIAKVPIFGNDLDGICDDTNLIEYVDGVGIPKILIKLVEMIKELNGFEKEGIFRISGNLQQVHQLKILLSKFLDNPEEISVQQFKDASVPCSTLKLWMRVLRTPLIPDELYTQFLVFRKNPQKLASLIELLPKFNYNIIFYVCSFLIELSAEEHREFTKMSLDNFSMIFSPCFMRCPLTSSAFEILRKSTEERELLREIFNHFISIKHRS